MGPISSNLPAWKKIASYFLLRASPQIMFNLQLREGIRGKLGTIRKWTLREPIRQRKF